MAIVENRASEVGDVIVIKASVPIIGLVTLASFTDSVLNESTEKTFSKEFRYSVDGINFSIWTNLTNENISQISITPTSTFLVEYRYTRVGTNTTLPPLEFNEVELTGEFIEISCGSTYSKSIFSKFFKCTDICVLNWMINVLEKLYTSVILPEYIERGDQGNDFNQDIDFIEFWKSITQYFAYIVCYARQWELSRATSNFDILIQYLRSQTLIFCGGESIQDLIYIMNNTYDEIRHRGTYEIIKTKSEGRQVNGEWHRLFCHLNKCTDWYFSSVFNYKIGWVGDTSSPLYQGNYFDKSLEKKFGSIDTSLDLEDYSKLSEEYISIEIDSNNTGVEVEVIQVNNVEPGEVSGIGHQPGPVNIQGLLPVSTKCEYELTFWVKLDELSKLSFGVRAYDVNGNDISSSSLVFAFSGNYSNLMAQEATLGRNDKYYFIRGIIYSHTQRVGSSEVEPDYYPNGINGATTLGNLRFNSTDVCYIYPTIYLDNSNQLTNSESLSIYDIKVRHLRTEYSTGFEQASNFIKMKVENQNPNLYNEEVEEVMREFLLPYNSTYKITFLNPPHTTNIEDILDILTTDDSRWTSPLTSQVQGGDRYLVYNNLGQLELYFFNISTFSWESSVDNVQGSIGYVINRHTVFMYDNNSWNFNYK